MSLFAVIVLTIHDQQLADPMFISSKAIVLSVFIDEKVSASVFVIVVVLVITYIAIDLENLLINSIVYRHVK